MADAEALLERLHDEGERRLASFTSEELVAVGADSPVQGLVISERLEHMGPIPLTAALSTALRGLVARGFVHPAGAAAGGAATRSDRHLQHVLDALSGAESGRDDGEVVSVPLSGELAIVVALRRSPALVCLVSEPSRDDLARRGPLAHRRTDAILHGFADEGRLAGFLEERRSALGIHSFVLRTLENEADALCRDLETRAREPLGDDAGGTCELALEVAAPGPRERPGVRLLVSLEPTDDGAQGRISWPAEPGAPAGETLSGSDLPRRLGELLAGIWRDDDGEAARVSAS